ncbi:MAG: alpha/beta hydrolase [Micrococcales bacterium]|nr:alpha/beta hydrolase [Micrococcales bacterium]
MGRTVSRSARGRAPVVAVVACAVLVLAACAPPGKNQRPVASSAATEAPPGLEAYYSQQLDWKECDDDRSLQCATMTVPMDYTDPGGETIEIAVARSQARNSQGSVVINPGGPGASGVDMVSYVASSAGKKLRESLDVVGFDPRGVQRSSAVACVDGEQMDAVMSFDIDGSTERGRAAATAMWTELGAACLENTGPLLGHVDTISAARDMDVLRAVLGETTLTYLGFSYGTQLGAVYAALFPERAGRLVLDGALSPTMTSLEASVGQAGGFESALRAYAEDCLTSASCPLRGSVDEAVAQVGAILTRARTNPIDTGTDRALTGTLAFLGVAMPLYSQDYWPYLTQALSAVIRDNDGSRLLWLADIYADREQDGTYSTNSMEAFIAIGCADDRGDADPAAMAAEAEQIRAVAPTVWEYFSWTALECAAWPTPPAQPLESYAAEGAPPIVVIGTTNDPATPYQWAKDLAALLSSSVMVTREGEGHTAYLSGNSCITALVDSFLVDGTVPKDGTTCS